MIKCTEIKNAIESGMPNIFRCEQNGEFLELSTPFLDPEGDLINIFVKPESKRIVVTDAGETHRNLFNYGIPIQLTKNRKKILDDVLSIYRINNTDSELWLEINRVDDVSMGIMRMGQTITRILDLVYTTRYVPKTNFNNRVFKFLMDNRINVEQDYRIIGGSGEEHKVDFKVFESKKIKLVKTLSAKDISGANILVSKTFRSWYDINRADASKKLTLLDDENDIWRDEWKAQLGYVSSVIKFDDKNNLLEFLLSA